MKKSSKIILSIIIFVLIATFVCLLFLNIYNKKQKEILYNEIQKLGYVTEIDTVLKTKNEYAKIEKEIKTKFSYLYLKSDELYKLYSNPEYTNILTVKNYLEDGKTFIKSKALLSDTKSKTDNIFKELQQLKKDSIIFTDSNENIILSKEYTKIYADIINKSSYITVIDETLNGYLIYFNNIQNILDLINYLENNQDSWNIKDNKLVYKTDEFITKYNELLVKVAINKG